MTYIECSWQWTDWLASLCPYNNRCHYWRPAAGVQFSPAVGRHHFKGDHMKGRSTAPQLTIFIFQKPARVACAHHCCCYCCWPQNSNSGAILLQLELWLFSCSHCARGCPLLLGALDIGALLVARATVSQVLVSSLCEVLASGSQGGIWGYCALGHYLLKNYRH